MYVRCKLAIHTCSGRLLSHRFTLHCARDAFELLKSCAASYTRTGLRQPTDLRRVITVHTNEDYNQPSGETPFGSRASERTNRLERELQGTIGVRVVPGWRADPGDWPLGDHMG